MKLAKRLANEESGKRKRAIRNINRLRVQNVSRPLALPVPTGSVGGQSYTKTNNYANTKGQLNGTHMIVERTEALYNVVTNATANAFRCEALTIHPGFGGFEWLRNLSNSYSQYEIHKMEFTYVPQCPTTTAGAVAMCFYPDVRDATPTVISEVLASEQSLYAPVFSGGDGGAYLQRFGAPNGNIVSFELPDHCIKHSNGTYKMFKVTSAAGMASIIGAANGSAVANIYSPGELMVATTGVATASLQTGVVFCRYRIKLLGPIAISTQQ